MSYIDSISCIICIEKEFSQFKQQNKREYASLEENENRFQIFCKNLQHAEKLNKLNPKAKFGVTKFSDLTRRIQIEIFRNKTSRKIAATKNNQCICKRKSCGGNFQVI
jgi:hypothetical protein